MKKKETKIIQKHIDVMNKTIINRYNIDERFVETIFDLIESKYANIILNNYEITDFHDNPVLVYKITLSICLNYLFDLDRFNRIDHSDEYIDEFAQTLKEVQNADLIIHVLDSSNEYINEFAQRIVSQTIYSDVDFNLLQTSPILNHPICKSILSLSSLIKYRLNFDLDLLRRKLHKDYSPVFILLKEAMESLEGTFLLISNKSFSQAMTVYRLYLEQIITVIALVKNSKLIDKYIEFQHLATKYAISTMDSDVLKLIEENHIPARDVKSYLNYGWIEYMDGFNDLPKRRYSIKVMAKLCQMEEVYGRRSQ